MSLQQWRLRDENFSFVPLGCFNPDVSLHARLFVCRLHCCFVVAARRRSVLYAWHTPSQAIMHLPVCMFVCTVEWFVIMIPFDRGRCWSAVTIIIFIYRLRMLSDGLYGCLNVQREENPTWRCVDKTDLFSCSNNGDGCFLCSACLHHEETECASGGMTNEGEIKMQRCDVRASSGGQRETVGEIWGQPPHSGDTTPGLY